MAKTKSQLPENRYEMYVSAYVYRVSGTDSHCAQYGALLPAYSYDFDSERCGCTDGAFAPRKQRVRVKAPRARRPDLAAHAACLTPQQQRFESQSENPSRS